MNLILKIKNNLIEFAKAFWQDKAAAVFFIITVALNAALLVLSVKNNVMDQPAIRLSLILALINIFLAFLSIRRIKLLSIMFLWTASFFAIYTLIYLFKVLL